MAIKPEPLQGHRGRQKAGVSTTERMLDQDFDANTDQAKAANELRTAAERRPEPAPGIGADRRHQACGQTDRGRCSNDTDIDEGQGDADRHRIQAGRNGGRDQNANRLARLRRPVLATAVGGWQWTWITTGTLSLAGLLLAWRLAAAGLDARRGPDRGG